MFIHLALFISTSLFFSTPIATIDCIPNPAYTVPSLTASDPLLQPLRSALDATVRTLLDADEYARNADTNRSEKSDSAGGECDKPPLFANITSFSVTITTREETIWEWHHSAEFQGSGSSKAVQNERNESEGEEDKSDSRRMLTSQQGGKVVDGATVYRIASCTKVFTVLALLLEENTNWDDPVTVWIPELQAHYEASGQEIENDNEFEAFALLEMERLTNHIHWESITLRSLASQLSGIPREYAIFDLLEWVPEEWIGRLEEVGFPPLDEDDDVPLGNNTSDKEMSKEDFLEGVKMQHPVFAPDHRSTYSNTGFVLLGIVLERMSGMKYTDLIAQTITNPLALSRTTFTKPDDKDGIIPTGPNNWDWGSELNWPTGGLYSTPDDTAAFLRSILRSELLSQQETNKWLQIQSTSQGHYGMPWEIFDTSQATSDGRTITMVTKSGGLLGYFSNLALIPEFGLGVSILVAGEKDDALETLMSTLHGVLLKGMDSMLRYWTGQMYTGTFVAQSKLNSSLELGIAETGGLEIKRWVSNGTDFLDVMAKVSSFPPLDNDSTMRGQQARLFPTGLQRRQKNAQGFSAMGEAWRLQILQLEDSGNNIFAGYCIGDIDGGTYAGRAINELLLFRGSDGRLEKVNIPALKVELVRKTERIGWVENAKGLVEQFGLW